MSDNAPACPQTSTRRWQLALAILAFGLLAWHCYDSATPGLLDRAGRVKAPDFLQFYTYGTLARESRWSSLYDRGGARGGGATARGPGAEPDRLPSELQSRGRLAHGAAGRSAVYVCDGRVFSDITRGVRRRRDTSGAAHHVRAPRHGSGGAGGRRLADPLCSTTLRSAQLAFTRDPLGGGRMRRTRASGTGRGDARATRLQTQPAHRPGPRAADDATVAIPVRIGARSSSGTQPQRRAGRSHGDATMRAS